MAVSSLQIVRDVLILIQLIFFFFSKRAKPQHSCHHTYFEVITTLFSVETIYFQKTLPKQ